MDKVRRENAKKDKKTIASIENAADDIYKKILRRGKPLMRFPVRSLSNVSYDKRKGYLEIGKARKERTLTVNTVKGFAQTLRMMGLSRDLVTNNDFATKRDVYYQSKNWEEDLNKSIIEAISRKPKGHDFVIRRKQGPSVNRHMSVTGG